MSKFEFKITKVGEDGGCLWINYIIIRANEKLDAFSKIENIFPTPQYNKQFIGTC
jgi:hypothetical protein